MNKLLPVGALSLALFALFALGYAYSVGQQPARQVGSTSQQVTDGNCLFENGVHLCPVRQPIAATSTVLCAMKSPAATSTLDTLSMDVGSAGSIPATVAFDFSTSTTGFASTTPGLATNVSFAKGHYTWQPSLASTSVTDSTVLQMVKGNGLSNNVIKPNTFVLVKLSTTTPATTYATGSCNARFEY